MATYRSILCATDFSACAQAALGHAEDLARRHDARLILAHVVQNGIFPVSYGLPTAMIVDYERVGRESAIRHLDPIVAALKARGVRARAVVLLGGAAEEIGDLVKQEGVDLLVVGTHGHRGLKHAVLGSTAERLVRTCPCPVLVVKATATTTDPLPAVAGSAKA